MYEIESRIRYSECDETGTISLLSLINYLQDSSTFHSEDIGRGVSYMTERNLAWLIAAWQIKIERLPRFCERIKVRTWCHSMSRTLAHRNFVMELDDGSTLVQADSLWFVFDGAAGRPIRIPDDQFVYLTGEGPLDLPPTERRVRVSGPYDEAPAVTVDELHLDSNRHVNNAQYLGMATNALAALYGTREGHRVTDISRICVQYKNQARLGDIIIPHVHRDGEDFVVDLAAPEGDSWAVVRLERRMQLA